MAAARELARYKLDLVGVQEVRWEKGGTVKAGDYSFLYGKGNCCSEPNDFPVGHHLLFNPPLYFNYVHFQGLIHL
jgi:hypothetical protein